MVSVVEERIVREGAGERSEAWIKWPGRAAGELDRSSLSSAFGAVMFRRGSVRGSDFSCEMWLWL
jgi:hypothetical protein